jgi:hypothetical protein
VEPRKEKIIKAFVNRVVETVCGEILTIHGIRCRMMRAEKNIWKLNKNKIHV